MEIKLPRQSEKNEALKPEHVRFKKKSQVTVPSKIVEALDLKEGDDLQCRLEDGKIVLVPTISIPKDQAWFWSEQWQKEEREVEQQIKDGKLSEAKNLEDTLSDLDKISKD
ncbi:AbrB/MazE/SpoVT family DNA-binding domain-containing protein [Salinicoccus sp. YB14-2]|uniref:AbrB/MazE/SpoVT family DNA-binding domain-containing protein n=1 Tax=Salinicoccus sp. YB14-2 TaxID=1572701 RepID=UPI0009E24808|nr:AbrB/MazE/SpoVT family DNA-binding domain-containing protein [Salinicoccus sp. YB14-2]